MSALREQLALAERAAKEDPQAMPYPALARARVAAWLEHMREITIDARLEQWAKVMTLRFGTAVKVWHNVLFAGAKPRVGALPGAAVRVETPELVWLTALMIVRWGEAIEHWPTAFTDDDILRAETWARGTTSKPHGITYLNGGEG